MGKNRLIKQTKPKCNRRYVITAAMLLLATSQAFAGWRLVYDPWTTGQVGANTTAQKLIENKHNERLDTISALNTTKLHFFTTIRTFHFNHPYKFPICRSV